MKIALVAKGGLPRRRRFRQLVSRLKAGLPDAEITVLESEYPGHAVELAAAAAAVNDCLIAAGGDGTLHEVLNGCLEQNGSRETRPMLGALPLGSANDYCRTLGMTRSADQLVALLKASRARAVDVGLIECLSSSGEPRRRFFLNVADLGIGAAVIQRMDSSGRRLGRKLSYYWAILASFITFRHVPLQVETDTGLAWEGSALILAAAKGRYIGSGLCVAPEARVDDGEFAILLVGRASVLDFILNLWRLLRGIPLEHPEASYHRARSISITAASALVSLEADGEFIGHAPARLEVVPAAIDFLVPD